MIWQLIRGLNSGANSDAIVSLLIQLAAVLVVMLVCLPFHEFAHAWMAKRQGDDTAFMHGRLTLNPAKHLDLIGTLMFLVVGFGFAKPVPVNPRKLRNYKKGMLLTALAGPASNLILAFPLALFSSVAFFVDMRVDSDISAMAFLFFDHVLMFNIFLMVFNMIPVPPLDGFAVLDFFLPYRASLFIGRYTHIIRWVFIALVIFGAFSWIIRFAAWPIYLGINGLFRFLVGAVFALF